MRLVIISGFSGSGKSIALHALEDEGFYCIDNLTINLLRMMLDRAMLTDLNVGEKIALSIDARGLGTVSADEFSALTEQIKQQDIKVDIIFIEASQATLIKRYQEAKRPHPLAGIRNTLEQAIIAEDKKLNPIRRCANIIIDTSNLLYYELIVQIRSQVCQSSLQVFLLLQSFGYKKGVPSDSDYVFDTRCLPNPYWHVRLRELTGKDSRVVEFMESNEKCREMYRQIHDFLENWINEFAHQGKCNLTISIGCTGGQHRSVYFVEKLFAVFQASPDYVVNKSHRELN